MEAKAIPAPASPRPACRCGAPDSAVLPPDGRAGGVRSAFGRKGWFIPPPYPSRTAVATPFVDKLLPFVEAIQLPLTFSIDLFDAVPSV
jgi:hypothetical protein